MAFCSRSRRRGFGLQHAGAGHRQVQIGADDLQQVVEIVRHSARQMADRFHFLGLAHDGLARTRSVWSTTPIRKPPVATTAL